MSPSALPLLIPSPYLSHPAAGLVARHTGESDAEYAARQSKLRPEVRRCTIVLAHAAVQAALAMGLLELRPWKPRTVGTLGMLASLINCYMVSYHRGHWGALV